MSTLPPRFARMLLEIVAPEGDRSFMLADLDEEFAERLARDGPRFACRWYRVQVLTSLGPMLGRRLRARRGIHPSHSFTRPAMDTLLQDLRFAVRSFIRRPGFTVTALTTLTVAIAANTAIFSVTNGVLLKRVPGVSENGRAVEIAGGSGDRWTDLPYPLVQAMAADAGSLDAVGALDWAPMSVGRGERPQVRLGAAVTAGYFDVLQVRAARGRLFTSEEATFPSVRPVAVISEHLRAERFAEAEIPGATVVVNGTTLTIVGVTAAGFRGHALTPMDVFVPLGLPIPGLSGEESLASMTTFGTKVMGRLRPGVSAGAAAEELTALGRTTMAAAGEEVPENFAVRVDDWSGVPAPARFAVTAFLTALSVLVGLILALACVNVAGTVLSRSAERRSEIAVRVAMGAGRGRIVRQLLSEATLLATAAGVLALPVSVLFTRMMLSFEPPLPPGFDLLLDLRPDFRVLAYCFLIAVTSAVLFNLAPALGASRTDVISTIKGGGSGTRMRTRTRGLLVAGQMGFAVVLLATAGVFMQALSSARNLETGWNAEGVWAVDLDLELTGTPPADGRALFAELTRTLAESPGVQAVGLTHRLPLSGRSVVDVTADGLESLRGRDGIEASFNRVSPGYFRTMEITLLQGRRFTDADVDGAPPVAVVNRTMATRLWADTDPIGKTFRMLRGGGDDVVLSVVGVVEDALYGSLFEVKPSALYLPSGQWYTAHLALLVKPEPGRVDEVSERVSSLLATLQPALPRQPMTPLSAAFSLALAPQRMAAWTSGIIGLLALLLGAVGVYGVTAFTVGQRIREIGIRMALGATERDVVGLVLGQGMVAPALGLLFGLAGAFVVARVIAGFMPGVGGADPAVFAAAAATLVFVAVAATFMPAWRAARSNPVKSLRTQ